MQKTDGPKPEGPETERPETERPETERPETERQDTERYLPLMIDFSGRKVVIFGGGPVGERKAALFSGVADTTVASLGFSEKLHELGKAGKVDLLELDLSGVSDEKLLSLVAGAFLVIPATSSSSLNERIAALAEREGCLVNRVEFAGPAVVPSLIRREGLMIGISTFGQSPAVSKFTRKKIESVIPAGYGGMIRLQAELRAYLKENVAEQKRRQELLWRVLDSEEVWEKLAESYEEAARFAYTLLAGQASTGPDSGSNNDPDSGSNNDPDSGSSTGPNTEANSGSNSGSNTPD